jgi:folate-binding protein YgfZ
MSKGMNEHAKSALLESRTVLRLKGVDRHSFLQGLISQDILLAIEGNPLFTAFLTPQGKYLSDFFVVPQDDGLLIDCTAEQVDDLAKRLGFFKMRADVILEDTRHYYSVFAFWQARSFVEGVFTDPRFIGLGERLIVPKKIANDIPTNASEQEYREHRYSLGVPEGLHEIEPGHATLLELNFEELNAISWNKGCYMGQELTARMYYRGLLKKRYLPFRYEGLMPQKGEILLHHGFEVGRIQARGETYGLGLFNLEKVRPFVEKKQMLVHGGVSYEIFLPPFLTDKIFS